MTHSSNPSTVYFGRPDRYVPSCVALMLIVVAEYIQGSQVFVQKIRSLAKKYRAIRRVRGDGNCFIRCTQAPQVINLFLRGNGNFEKFRAARVAVSIDWTFLPRERYLFHVPHFLVGTPYTWRGQYIEIEGVLQVGGGASQNISQDRQGTRSLWLIGPLKVVGLAVLENESEGR